MALTGTVPAVVNTIKCERKCHRIELNQNLTSITWIFFAFIYLYGFVHCLRSISTNQYNSKINVYLIAKNGIGRN